MRINGNIFSQNIEISNISDLLGKLNVGDVIKARIMEITSNELMLKLFDGTTIKAASMVPIEAQRGDAIELVVRNKDDKKLFLETVKSPDTVSKQEEADFKKLLSENGIKSDDKNINILKEIKANDIPFNKENFTKLLEAVNKYKTLSAAEAAFLESNGIPLNEKNITALKQIVEGSSRISSHLQELSGLVNKLDPETKARIISRLPLPENEPETINNGTTLNKSMHVEGLRPEMPQNTDVIELVKEAFQNLAASRDSSNAKNTNVESMGIKLLELIKNAPQDKAELLDFIKNEILPELTKTKDISIPQKNEFMEVIKNILSRIDNGKEKIKINQKEADPGVVKPSVDTDLPEKALNTAESNEKPAAVKRDVEYPSKEEKAIDDNMEKIFRKLTADIDSTNLKDEINVRKMYSEVTDKLEALREIIDKSNIPARQDIPNKIDSMDSNIKFMNQVNLHNSYVQIPITMGNNNATCELYILKRKSGRKAIDPENASLLISLDTQNIGRVDTLVGVKGKNVSVNMKLENENAFGVIREKHKDLYNRLMELGYRLVDFKFRQLEEKANLVNAKKVMSNEINSSIKRIDYKI